MPRQLYFVGLLHDVGTIVPSPAFQCFFTGGSQGIAMRNDTVRRAVGLPTMAELKSINAALAQVRGV